MRTWLACAAVAVLMLGCSGRDRGTGDGGGGTVDSGGGGDTDGGGGGDDAGGGGGDDAGGPPPGGGCSPTTVTSTCGDNAVIRVRATLGPGMAAASGNLVANQYHLRLGSGSTGGVPHTGASTPSVSLTAGEAAEVAFDHCAGGEMWSEENCEYNIWAFIDSNGNGSLDAGEPAGRAVHELSCFDTGPTCWNVVLDCLDGPSCIAFTDPGACRCASPGCMSDIVTCS